MLKPLHGDEPELFRNLASFCAQDYPGHFELVLGVGDANDPAVAVVTALRAAFPGVEATLVVDGRRRGTNGKVSNLMNMDAHARHPVLVLADSDIRVGPGYLRAVVGALAAEDVGAVTCLYRGLALPNLWSRLAAQWIDAHFLPNVVVGMALGLAKPCFGSTIALRRDTLERIGGFASFKDKLADDYALGEAVRGLGLAVAVPKTLVLGHLCAATRFGDVLAQELRWARTIRSVDPAGFAGSIVTHALPIAAIAAFAAGFSTASLAVFCAALACRLAVFARVARFAGHRPAAALLLPLRDALAFVVFVLSFWPGTIAWRGDRFALRGDGTLASPSTSR